jgi:SAM-dependent methyltransferase
MKNKINPVVADQAREIADWFESSMGKQVVQAETAIIDELLEEMFGYHILQLSVQQADLCTKSPIQHRMKAAMFNVVDADLTAFPDALPFESDCIDVLISHHFLDFSDRPQDLVREFSRVVLPGGRLILVGFNPYSLWGLTRLLMPWGHSIPWNSRFLAPDRLMDWLNILNFRIDRAIYSEYGLPFKGRHRPRPDYSLGLSRRFNFPFGAVSIIVARKQVETMTPVKPKWFQRRSFSNLSLVKPVARWHPGSTEVKQEIVMPERVL